MKRTQLCVVLLVGNPITGVGMAGVFSTDYEAANFARQTGYSDWITVPITSGQWSCRAIYDYRR